jgi:hypothetical protein
VKFTPEEMAIDAADVDASKPTFWLRGLKEWRAFLSFKRGYVRLQPDVRSAFPNDDAVNTALRSLMKSQGAKRRKSA